MDWQKMENVEVGTNRFADGEWRIVEDEIEIKVEVKSNGLNTTFPVAAATGEGAYPIIAGLLIQALNCVEPR